VTLHPSDGQDPYWSDPTELAGVETNPGQQYATIAKDGYRRHKASGRKRPIVIHDLAKGSNGNPLPKNLKMKGNFPLVSILSDVIKWPHPEIPLILSKLDKVENLEDFEIPKLLDHSLERVLTRFKETLCWWAATTPKVTGTPKGIFYQSLERGPEFADELDDAIKYSMRESASCSLLYGGADWPTTVKAVSSLDEFFSPYHLPNFQRPENEDILLLFEDPPKIEERFLSRFKSKLREFVLEPNSKKRELDDLDRVKLLTTTSTFDPETNSRIQKMF
jgi:hypothetical protein